SIEDDGRNLLWSVEPNVAVEGDRELLAQAFINLLENAQRHTPRGTLVRFTLVSAGKFACVTVIDNGLGVADADLSRIRKRFARLEASRNTAGHGLGLSLVDAVAKLHGGRFVLRGAAPGLSATMELPLLSGRLTSTGERAEISQAREDTE